MGTHLMIASDQVDSQDLRERDPVVKKFFKTSIAITSMALHPDNPQQFLVGQETGSILRYDVRNPMKVMGRIWGAHGNRPVTDLKWKTSSEGGWLASAGADRAVHVRSDIFDDQD